MAGTLVEFFDNPSKWTQGYVARDARGIPVNSYDSSAVCFCLYGAITEVYPNSHERLLVLDKLREVLMTRTSDYRLAAWNDDSKRTFEDIVDLCKRAGV